MCSSIFSKTLKVTEASIDVLGHVNNKEYLRWMEDLAIEHSAALGWPQERYLREKHVWVAREHWIEYLRPALLGDELALYTWISAVAGPVSLRRYAFVRHGKLVTLAATEWAHIDFVTKKVCTVPESLLNAFDVVAPDDPRLKELGISRPVKWIPRELGLPACEQGPEA
ncbi:acyl-CoA thioesterase [Mesosutterella sp. OilRF-GAM-744-9]|uniref:Acyl-CoA thioesterase n=1 Tax=Mesosutterella porci TaxID=2915351 RepID=A0ABS9MS83_9BURK|nr:thioesterase family protein [Mesosutterella sp. oilRF-744-WT-GAM-9]MCG5031095.1 acyl-CoA thioesterase [Mesosutterella sp. oilRF-744-WT-GAM-9]MCI6531306.1 acyl-CoA thioesterase [Mesosutterella sp.]